MDLEYQDMSADEIGPAEQEEWPLWVMLVGCALYMTFEMLVVAVGLGVVAVLFSLVVGGGGH